MLDRLPDRFTLAELELSLASLERDGPPHAISFETAKIIRVLASSSYVTTFPTDSALSERVIFPAGPHETHGMEDARFVRFTDDDGAVTLLRDLHRVRRLRDHAAADPDRRFRLFPHLDAQRPRGAEQRDGVVPAAGRREVT